MVVVSVLMGSLLMACSTMTKAEREAKEAEQAKMVKEALDKPFAMQPYCSTSVT